MMKVQRDLHIRNRPTRLNRANSNSTMRKMLLVGIKTTTNIGFVGDDVGSAGYDVTEAGLQITAESVLIFYPLVSLTRTVADRSLTV